MNGARPLEHENLKKQPAAFSPVGIQAVCAANEESKKPWTQSLMFQSLWRAQCQPPSGGRNYNGLRKPGMLGLTRSCTPCGKRTWRRPLRKSRRQLPSAPGLFDNELTHAKPANPRNAASLKIPIPPALARWRSWAVFVASEEPSSTSCGAPSSGLWPDDAVIFLLQLRRNQVRLACESPGRVPRLPTCPKPFSFRLSQGVQWAPAAGVGNPHLPGIFWELL